MKAFATPGPSRASAYALDPKTGIRDRALSLGFDAVGFARPGDAAQAGAHLLEFIRLGRHGDMGWLAARATLRADPHILWPEARTAIVIGANYAPSSDPLATLGEAQRGAISVYAARSDYHDSIGRRLKALSRWIASSFAASCKSFVDTAPLLEKPLAQSAGIGWQGKHTNLVSEQWGSWLFLGAILTTLDLAPDLAAVDRCGTCHACLDACPTQAFPAPYQIDARRCISYLTIEHKGPIDREFRRAIGNRIFGCDDCLAVCPWNKFAQAAHDATLAIRPDLAAPMLQELAQLDDAAFRARFRGTAIKRTGRDRFVRNVVIALGNSGDCSAVPLLERLLDDLSPLVRGMAVWALGELLDRPAWGELYARRASLEADPSVRVEWAAFAP